MNAKEVSAINFFAMAVAHDPKKLNELLARAKVSTFLCETYLFSALEKIQSPSSIEEILERLNNEHVPSVQVFKFALQNRTQVGVSKSTI